MKDSGSILDAASEVAFRDLLFQQHPDLELLRDAADASKHQVRTRKGATAPTATGVTIMENDSLVIGDTGGCAVEDLLTSVMNFWERWLQIYEMGHSKH